MDLNNESRFLSGILTEISQKNVILTILLVAILDFKVADMKYITLRYSIGFLDIKNIGLDTKIKSLRVTLTKLWPK